MPPTLTLADLRRMRGCVSMAALARAAGLNRQTLHERLKNGSPELAPFESKRITRFLAEHGLRPLDHQPQ